MLVMRTLLPLVSLFGSRSLWVALVVALIAAAILLGFSPTEVRAGGEYCYKC
jgi:hypothetical protein